jgi:prepilin-type processing-associated H-X9-DG protein
MMPVFAMVRARADALACAANLKQVGAMLGAYLNDNNNLLPGPLNSAQMPNYSTADPTQLAGFIAPYLGLPAPSAASVKAPIMVCPSYAKVDPALDKPVYAIDEISQAATPFWAFGSTSDGSKPKRLVALAELTGTNGNPLTLSNTMVMRDYLAGASATLVTTSVTYNSSKPVHNSFLNALYFDWHVGTLKANTLAPE